MNLAQVNKGPWLLAADGTDVRQESCAVAFDRTTRVLLGESEIESVPSINVGESGGACAESMD